MSHIPHIHLLCMRDEFIAAFRSAAERHALPPSIEITIHDCPLNQVPPATHFDTIVSPANSSGRMDGAFDDAISRVISPRDDYLALTRVAQRTLYTQWRGFAPPGSCTLIDVPADFEGRNRNVWGVRRVALCPTMRTPGDTLWDREVVYECVWSLLCTVARTHDEHQQDGKKEPIHSVLMTPLATGCGRVPPDRWAAQLVLALKHFAASEANPDVWGALTWEMSHETAGEVQTTWDDQQ